MSTLGENKMFRKVSEAQHKAAAFAGAPTNFGKANGERTGKQDKNRRKSNNESQQVTICLHFYFSAFFDFYVGVKIVAGNACYDSFKNPGYGDQRFGKFLDTEAQLQMLHDLDSNAIMNVFKKREKVEADTPEKGPVSSKMTRDSDSKEDDSIVSNMESSNIGLQKGLINETGRPKNIIRHRHCQMSDSRRVVPGDQVVPTVNPQQRTDGRRVVPAGQEGPRVPPLRLRRYGSQWRVVAGDQEDPTGNSQQSIDDEHVDPGDQVVPTSPGMPGAEAVWHDIVHAFSDIDGRVLEDVVEAQRLYRRNVDSNLNPADNGNLPAAEVSRNLENFGAPNPNGQRPRSGANSSAR